MRKSPENLKEYRLLIDINKECKRVKYNLFETYYERDFELIEKDMDKNGKISDTGLRNIVVESTHRPFLRYFLREQYNYSIPEVLMDDFINRTPATEIHFLLQRNDLNSHQIDRIILEYEAHRGTNIGNLIESNPELFSSAVINHLYKNRSKDFERWNYAPFKLISKTEYINETIEMLSLFPNNEKLNTAVINNLNFPVKVREECFENGCDYLKVEGGTPKMVEEIYASAVQMVFDYDYIFEYAQKIDNAKKQIIKHIDMMPHGCIYDLIRRCEHSGRFEELMSSVVSNTNNGKILAEILKLNYKTPNMLIINKQRIDEALYKEITKDIKLTSSKRQYAIKMLYTNPIFDESILNEFLEKPDKNMMMAMIIAPYHSKQLDEKMYAMGDSEIKTLYKIKEKLNEENRYFNPRVHFALLEVFMRLSTDHSSKAPREILGTYLNAHHPQGLLRIEESNFIKKQMYSILEDKEANPRVKSAVRSFLNSFEKDLTKNQPFLCRNTTVTEPEFQIFKIENNKVLLDVHNVEKLDTRKYEQMKESVKDLPEETLRKMKKIIANGITGENHNSKDDIIFRAYKLKDLYNTIDDRIEEIRQEKINQSEVKKEDDFEK